MFNVEELMELLKDNDFEEVRAAFDMALDEANEKHEEELSRTTYQRGTSEFDDDFFHRLDDNKSTMEDVVTMLYAVLYRDYPEMREALNKGNIKQDTKTIEEMIKMILNPSSIADTLDQLFSTSSSSGENKLIDVFKF